MKRRSGWNIMRNLIVLVKPLLGYMVLAVAMGVAGFLCAIFITVFGGYAMLDVLKLPTMVHAGTAFVCVLIFALLRGFLRYGEQACNHFIAFKLLALIRDRVFRALRKLCPAKLEGRDRGNLISVITSDIELLEVFYAHTISPAVIAALMTVIMTLFIGSFHWILGAVALLAYLVIGIAVPMTVSKVSGRSGRILRTRSGELSSFVLDSRRGVKESIQYHTGEERLAELNKRTDELSAEEEKMKLRAGWNMASVNTLIYLFDFAVLAAGLALYAKGIISFDAVLIPLIAMMSSFGPVVALANLGSTLPNTLAAGSRVLDILDEEPAVEEIAGREETVFGGAQASHVGFSYGDEAILSDVSVSLPKDKIIGITGRSGSGKSTLLKLLMRFWETQQGEIRISGRNVNTVNTADLRGMESYVTQETHLFHDSIANNVRIARVDASREEIAEACKKASVHEFIESLPNGYDTKVGELGDTLSGGERQRIGLARAFLHNAPLLLLDEPTSNLDSLNEAVILKSLHKERKGRTVVLVSHRQSTMRIADQVYSVEHGRMS